MSKEHQALSRRKALQRIGLIAGAAYIAPVLMGHATASASGASRPSNQSRPSKPSKPSRPSRPSRVSGPSRPENGRSR